MYVYSLIYLSAKIPSYVFVRSAIFSKTKIPYLLLRFIIHRSNIFHNSYNIAWIYNYNTDNIRYTPAGSKYLFAPVENIICNGNSDSVHKMYFWNNLEYIPNRVILSSYQKRWFSRISVRKISIIQYSNVIF